VNILIVEDDQPTQVQLRTWLEEWGEEVAVAGSKSLTRELLDAGKADLILCNWHLRDLTGHDLCRMLGDTPRHPYILVYSSDVSEEGALTCTDAGADDVLSSPINPVALRLRIMSAERTLKARRVFEQKAVEYRALNEKLEQAYETLHSELVAASQLQLSLLPTITEVHPKFSLDWLVLPSSYLAGDNLNYFMMQERYLIFYHLDVAGHGVPSALLSVTLNQLLSPQPGSPMVRFDPNLELKRIVPPVEVVSELNRRFQPQGDGYFTMIYAVLDTETHQIRFCQAGHPSPIKFHVDGSTSIIGDGGFPVGLWPGMTYDEETTMLMPGERLLLYSDGIIACVNKKDVAYSLERLQEIIKAHAGQPIKMVLQAVREDLELWSEGRDYPDDISLLLVEAK
jgi:sigma-B regulation protein RsbU (phosphoserine phosphatase)